MKTHKLIENFTDIDEEYLLHALGKDKNMEIKEDNNIISAEPMEVKAGKPSPLKLIIPIAAAAAALAVAIPVGFNAMRNRNDVNQYGAYASGQTESSEEAATSVITPAASAPDTSAATPDAPSPDAPSAEHPFVIKYLKGTDENAEYPYSCFVTSPDELKAQFGNVPPEIDSYDDAFFKKANLVLLRVGDQSGSIKVEVRYKDSGLFREGELFFLDQIIEEKGHADMGYWNILFPVDCWTDSKNYSVEVFCNMEDKVPPMSEIAAMTDEEALSALQGLTEADIVAAWGYPTWWRDPISENNGIIHIWIDSGKVIRLHWDNASAEAPTSRVEITEFPEGDIDTLAKYLYSTPEILPQGNFVMEEFSPIFMYTENLVTTDLGKTIFDHGRIKQLALADLNDDIAREFAAVITNELGFDELWVYDIAGDKKYVLPNMGVLDSVPSAGSLELVVSEGSLYLSTNNEDKMPIDMSALTPATED